MVTPDRIDSYRRKLDRSGEKQRAASKAAGEVGDLPPIVNPERRAAGLQSFRAFCESYFPDRFTLAWSEDHLKVIAKIERAVSTGGQFAVAMPRGSGKSSLCEVAVLWAVFSGSHPYVVLIGSDEGAAESQLESIQTEIEFNELLAEDFPEIITPIRKLEGIHQRKLFYRGQRVYLDFTSKRLVLPTMPDSPAADAVLEVAGLTGRLRGRSYSRHDGRKVRPSLVLLDDPQTDESARSPSQVATREKLVCGAVLGLAGPGKKIAALATVTKIAADDLADRLLSREKHPEWQGECTKLLNAMPTNTELWEQYAKILHDSLANDGGMEPATAFYKEHREAMDAGAAAAWPARHNADELSAIQYAMNLKLRDEESFFAEYQNEPKVQQAHTSALPADRICGKANNIPRGTVPAGHSHVVAFIDVQEKALFWAACSWSDSFGGHVLDYGIYPEQGKRYITLREIKKSLVRAKPGAGIEGAILDGLKTLTDKLLTYEWKREDGVTLRIERCLIDANWGNSTRIVRAFCRRSTRSAQLLPSHGRYYGASSTPINDRPAAEKERIGHYWRISIIEAQRHLVWDTNHWKSFVAGRLAMAAGESGGLTLFGTPADHQMLADHITAEFPIEVAARGRTLQEWKAVPGRDNHYLDCLVGCAVAASFQGCSALHGQLPAARKTKPRRSRRVSYL